MEIRRRDNGGIMAFGMVQLAFAASSMGESESAYDMLKWLGKAIGIITWFLPTTRVEHSISIFPEVIHR